MPKSKLNPSMCQYYPCHSAMKDGSEFICNTDMCFCPIYPCSDETKGQWLNEFVWDCTDCTFNHTREFKKWYEESLKNSIN